MLTGLIDRTKADGRAGCSFKADEPISMDIDGPGDMAVDEVNWTENIDVVQEGGGGAVGHDTDGKDCQESGGNVKLVLNGESPTSEEDGVQVSAAAALEVGSNEENEVMEINVATANRYSALVTRSASVASFRIASIMRARQSSLCATTC